MPLTYKWLVGVLIAVVMMLVGQVAGTYTKVTDSSAVEISRLDDRVDTLDKQMSRLQIINQLQNDEIIRRLERIERSVEQAVPARRRPESP